MPRNITASKRGFGYREATGGRGALGLYTDGLLVAEYENYLGNGDPVTIYGKNLTSVDQWFNEESETKNYAIGTKMVVEDMVFRYGHIEVYRDSAWRGRGMSNLGKQTSVSHLDAGYLNVSAGTAASAEATSLTLTIDNAYAATANEFENGVLQLSSEPWSGYVTGRIKSNTATSTTTTFTLKEGIIAAIDSTPSGKLNWNPYAYTGTPKTDSYCASRSSIVGCLNVNATADYYVWLQTWGPYICQPGGASGSYPGEGVNQRIVFFDMYGGFLHWSASAAYQRAGIVLPCTVDPDADGRNGWATLVMLQLSP